jgi:hypothetical protein
MFQFLKEYCVPNCIHAQSICPEEIKMAKLQLLGADNMFGYVTHDDSCSNERFFKLNGLLTMGQLWMNQMIVIPDVVYKLHDTKIHSYSNTAKSKIVSTMNMSFTQMFDLPFHAMVPRQNPTRNLPNGKKRSSIPPVEITMFDDSIRDVLTRTPLRVVPDYQSVEMKLTMFLNENKFIEKFEIDAL